MSLVKINKAPALWTLIRIHTFYNGKQTNKQTHTHMTEVIKHSAFKLKQTVVAWHAHKTENNKISSASSMCMSVCAFTSVELTVACEPETDFFYHHHHR